MNDSNLLNGGQVIIDYLIREKVPYLFGLCGHGNIGLIDAMHERADEISTISVHHESVSGFMADVYYRVSGLQRLQEGANHQRLDSDPAHNCLAPTWPREPAEESTHLANAQSAAKIIRCTEPRTGRSQE